MAKEQRTARLAMRIRPSVKRKLDRILRRGGWRSYSEWVEIAIVCVDLGGVFAGLHGPFRHLKKNHEPDPAGVGDMTARPGAEAPAGSLSSDQSGRRPKRGGRPLSPPRLQRASPRSTEDKA